MLQIDDVRLSDANNISVEDIVLRLGLQNLKSTSGEFVGPCPCCGGRDRFAINIRSKKFNCRKCEIKGCGIVGLVMKIRNVGFRAALDWLCGKNTAPIDPKETARRQHIARQNEAKAQAQADRYRQYTVRTARNIWQSAKDNPVDILWRYLETRGLDKKTLGTLPLALRFIPNHPYVKKICGQSITLYRGPCMLGAIQGADGKHYATHQTWLEKTPPFGKATITYDGDAFPPKLVRGSKKGGSVRLYTAPCPETLVMGEGIETTLSALVCHPVAGASYWAGVDLGNMAGRMVARGGVRYSGAPDLNDDSAFIPPAWCKRLIFIQDGDSEPKMTRAKLICGLRRAMAKRKGLKGQIVFAGEGIDLNDLLTGNINCNGA